MSSSGQGDDQESSKNKKDEQLGHVGDDHQDDDDHEHDMVMPGFRFHPTEEELVEFYLRRKVEGRRFNVELITFLDLYRYDPWELPAMAAIGEKEWFFYVPRDRKYRNGDRPNRVTTSGYWKATGADRMIRADNSSRSIGLKKTLVFYSGKAPKGIRTSWIMNEYRLPQHETERYQKAEISLCRVYKRAGVEDHHSLPRSLTGNKTSSSRQGGKMNTNNKNVMIHPQLQLQQIETPTDSGSSSSDHHHHHQYTASHVTTSLGLIFKHEQQHHINNNSSSSPNNNNQHHVYLSSAPPISTALGLTAASQHPPHTMLLQHDHHHSNKSQATASSLLVPTTNITTSFLTNHPTATLAVDDLHTLVNFNQLQAQQQPHLYYNNLHHPQFSPTLPLIPPPPHLELLNSSATTTLPSSLPTTFTTADRIWEWNTNQDPAANRSSDDRYTNINPFK